jgi:hypothetical protein
MTRNISSASAMKKCEDTSAMGILGGRNAKGRPFALLP